MNRYIHALQSHTYTHQYDRRKLRTQMATRGDHLRTGHFVALFVFFSVVVLQTYVCVQVDMCLYVCIQVCRHVFNEHTNVREHTQMLPCRVIDVAVPCKKMYIHAHQPLKPHVHVSSFVFGGTLFQSFASVSTYVCVNVDVVMPFCICRSTNICMCIC